MLSKRFYFDRHDVSERDMQRKVFLVVTCSRTWNCRCSKLSLLQRCKTPSVLDVAKYWSSGPLNTRSLICIIHKQKVRERPYKNIRQGSMLGFFLWFKFHSSMTKQKWGVYNTKTAIIISELPDTHSSFMNSEPIPYLLVWPWFSKRWIQCKIVLWTAWWFRHWIVLFIVLNGTYITLFLPNLLCLGS